MEHLADMQCKRTLGGLSGVFNDEISLVTAIAQQDHQSMPSVEYDEDQTNQKQRFQARVYINLRPVGCGTGKNKPEAKLEAFKRALHNIAEPLYQ